MNTDEHFERRFYILNAFVTVILLIAVFISIDQFGNQAWESRTSVGLILPGGKDEQGWNKVQYKGMFAACEELNYDLHVVENVSAQNSMNAVQTLADKGTKLIFVSGSTYDVEQLTKQYPRIRFYSIESTFVSSNMSKYSIRYIDLRYLSGVLAGIRTKTNLIGYIASTPTAPIMQGINAFTLGVRHVNPNAQVLLTWTGSLDNPSAEEQAVSRLKSENVDVISYFQDGNTIPLTSEKLGIDFISFHEAYPNCKHYLGCITANWKSAYLTVLRAHHHQAYSSAFIEEMTEDVAVFEPFMNNLTMREKVFLESAKWELTHGQIVFAGNIIDRDDIVRCAENESIGGQYLMENMNWLVKGVRTVGN